MRVPQKIDAYSKSIRMLLANEKYGIDYYQREYRWERKHIEEMLKDLEDRFFEEYDDKHERIKVENYPNYFLGSIIISEKNGRKYIIDGQQRLTSLTLLLIYLQDLQRKCVPDNERVEINSLIYSIKFGEKSFNLDIDERTNCMEALYKGQPFDTTNEIESVSNIIYRYDDIVELFPKKLKEDALLYFIDWLTENVIMVEITAYSDDEAYTIFETMNDRGLRLNPTEMLKGYLLANIDPNERAKANKVWKTRILELIDLGKEEELDFFKAWFRAKYANSIRPRTRGAVNQDFEQIGTAYHKWIRKNEEAISLLKSTHFSEFVQKKFDWFAKHYIRVRKAAETFTPGLETIFYNAYLNFTLQYPLILTPLCIEDDLNTIDRKIQLVTSYIDIFTARRIVNFRTLRYSSIVYTMFSLMKEIRDLNVQELADVLKKKVSEIKETFNGISTFYWHQQNRRHVHYLLARITYHIETKCGLPSSFDTYVSRDISKPFEIEHIWANKFSRHSNEFTSEEEFKEYRNRLGGLLLLPRGFNQSFGALPYEKKLDHYYGQNLLAQSLHKKCYHLNPSFLIYIQDSQLPFKAHPQFRKQDLETRQELYRQICEEIWNPNRFDKILKS